ncbi:MAG: peptide deformylase [Selenomonadaceae bacterium]|nr:peptide deformylase [Selenomonadaceae bacterium]
MNMLEIKTAGDPVLKKVCEPVTKIDKRLRRLLDDMAETMYASDGVGIAAPQVGESIRVCVVDVDTKSHNERYDLINPVITYREGSVVDNEGCLSCPDLFGDVERSAKIRVEYTSRFNKKKTLEAEGLLARCIQHEIDHLDGKLFIDVAKNITKGRPNKKTED